jgi:murein DD-endopeptidase MepM/ murein hydrolase activator NlpD
MIKNRYILLLLYIAMIVILANIICGNAQAAGAQVSSNYGWRINPFTGIPQHHNGVDIAAPYGSKVLSIASGTVMYTGWINGYGYVVQIKHDNGYCSQYGHLSAYAQGITPGTRVGQGEHIAYLGSSGQSTGPHLDLRVWKGNSYVNPHDLLGIEKTKNTTTDIALEMIRKGKGRAKGSVASKPRRRPEPEIIGGIGGGD